MAEPNTRSTQEAGRTTGTGASSAQTSQTTDQSSYGVGQSSGHSGQMSSSATRQAREHMPESGTSSTMERGAEMMDQAKQTVSDAYNRASRSMNETWEQAMDYSRQNPGTATLIAFGAGIGVGLLIASSFSSRSRAQRVIPPVMNALSEIASELFR
ncbi:MAG TPA: hypothetical protein VNQ79_04440 [Blastocatellia bacterium]|nr:hypothetical protein [Blastocatellia bacterium]